MNVHFSDLFVTVANNTTFSDLGWTVYIFGFLLTVSFSTILFMIENKTNTLSEAFSLTAFASLLGMFWMFSIPAFIFAWLALKLIALVKKVGYYV